MTIHEFIENGTLRHEQMFPGAVPVLCNAPRGRRSCYVCGKWQPYKMFKNGPNSQCCACLQEKPSSKTYKANTKAHRNSSRYKEFPYAVCDWCGKRFKPKVMQVWRMKQGKFVFCCQSHAASSSNSNRAEWRYQRVHNATWYTRQESA